ncbi:MAG: hypothetical protein H7Z75_07140 [Ferruginibacter sp.]|nr:hypothetical protein [Cytophagales bacterium]
MNNPLPTLKPKSVTNAWIAHAFLALTFYSYGTAMMDYFLVYPSRALIGEREFVVYHALLEERIVPISVVPFALLTVLNVLLFWFRPTGWSRQLVWASFGCLLVDWASSLFIQIPMNLRLNGGKDPALIQRVMETNWGRVFLETTQALLAFRLLQLNQSNGDQTPLTNGQTNQPDPSSNQANHHQPVAFPKGTLASERAKVTPE